MWQTTTAVGVLSRAIGLPVRSMKTLVAAFAQVSLAASAVFERLGAVFD